MNEEIELLRAALRELKDAGAATAHVRIGGVELAVTFQPDLPAMPVGAPVEPGGWKVPTLDEPAGEWE